MDNIASTSTASWVRRFTAFAKLTILSRGILKKITYKIVKYLLKGKAVEYAYFEKKFVLYPHDNTTDAKMLISGIKREQMELGYLKRLNKTKNSVFLDIGANMGYYSIMSSSFGFEKIFAIEVHPEQYARLVKNIAINNLAKTIVPICIALGDDDKKKTMYVCGDHGGSTLNEAQYSSHQSINDSKADKIQVNVITLQKLLIQNSLTQIDALKIDVEGFEDKVLMPFFRHSSPDLYPKLVIIELSDSSFWDEDVIEWMMNNGYRCVCKSRSNSILEHKSVSG